MTKLATAALVLAIAACGGGDKNKNPDASTSHPDAPGTPDAPRSCTGVTTGMADFLGYNAGSTPVIAWGGPLTGDLGDGNTLVYQFEFYGGIESSLAGTFSLTAGKQANYATCAICVRAFDLDGGGNVVKELFQSGGSITLTEDPFTNQHMIASLTDLQLQEVTIDPNTYTSTPVTGGTCTSFAAFSIDHDKVPNAWTCQHSAYADGTSCDCMCGLTDPDCATAGAPVVGCTSGQICFQDACATPPANDTCGAAIALTLGTATPGTTLGAVSNYNAGLDGMTCDGVSQAGPDVAYKVDLTQGQNVTVALTGLDPAFDGSVALLGPGDATLCDAAPITTCVMGGDAGAEGVDEMFTYAVPTTGTYYVIVDSFYTNEAGAFTLTVTAN